MTGINLTRLFLLTWVVLSCSSVQGFIQPTLDDAITRISHRQRSPVHPLQLPNSSLPKSQPLPLRSSSAGDDAFPNASARSSGLPQQHPLDDPPVAVSTSLSVPEALKSLRARHEAKQSLSQEFCDSILAICVANDEWDSVLDVLDIMQHQGLAYEPSSYRACLQACFDLQNPASAKEILYAMEQAHIKPTGQDLGLVVTTMCRKESTEPGWLPKALSILHEANPATPIPINTYDTLLAALVKEKGWKEAVRLVRNMESRRNPPPSLSTYRIAIECCTQAQQPEQAVQLLSMCVQKELVPTVHTFELVVGALSKKLQWRRALQIFDMMDQLGVPRTLILFNMVLTACAKAKEVVQAKNMLMRMKKEGIRPDIVSYNNVISVAAATGRWKDALSILDQCHREPGVEPDIYTYTNAIRACAKGGMTKRALTFLQVVKDKADMKDSTIKLDAYVYTAAIEACSKAGMWKRALSLLEEMERRGVAPTEISYSVAITACGNGGEWQTALNLLNAMQEKGMKVNLITYNNAIAAVSRAAKKSHQEPISGDLWDIVLDLLNQIREDGLEPDGFSYSAAIGCCAAEGRWREAMDLIDVMLAGGPKTQPNKVAYTSAITACGRAGEVDHALYLFRQLRDQGLSADKVAYNALFSAFRVAKRGDAAYNLWNEMKGTGSRMSSALVGLKSSHGISPDIVTLTDCLGALTEERDFDKADRIFAEAVDMGIILNRNDLDNTWEYDFTGFSFPVARCACRFILNQMCSMPDLSVGDSPLVFITGVGSGKIAHKGSKVGTTLREYLQQTIMSEFGLDSEVPSLAQGTLEIERRAIIDRCKT